MYTVKNEMGTVVSVDPLWFHVPFPYIGFPRFVSQIVAKTTLLSLDTDLSLSDLSKSTESSSVVEEGVLVCAVRLVTRLSNSYTPPLAVSHTNCYLLFGVCLMLATKMYVDVPFSNAAFSELFAFPLDKLNALERITLARLDYDVRDAEIEATFIADERERERVPSHSHVSDTSAISISITSPVPPLSPRRLPHWRTMYGLRPDCGVDVVILYSLNVETMPWPATCPIELTSLCVEFPAETIGSGAVACSFARMLTSSASCTMSTSPSTASLTESSTLTSSQRISSASAPLSAPSTPSRAAPEAESRQSIPIPLRTKEAKGEKREWREQGELAPVSELASLIQTNAASALAHVSAVDELKSLNSRAHTLASPVSLPLPPPHFATCAPSPRKRYNQTLERKQTLAHKRAQYSSRTTRRDAASGTVEDANIEIELATDECIADECAIIPCEQTICKHIRSSTNSPASTHRHKRVRVSRGLTAASANASMSRNSLLPSKCEKRTQRAQWAQLAQWENETQIPPPVEGQPCLSCESFSPVHPYQYCEWRSDSFAVDACIFSFEDEPLPATLLV